MDEKRDYDDVPGTYILDSRSYRKGYHLNMFCMSLNKPDCRAEFALYLVQGLARLGLT